MTKPSLSFLAFLCAVPLAASGQTYFELTPLAGYQVGGEIDFEDEFGPFTIDFDDDPTFGLALDIPLSRAFQVELLISRQSTSLSIDEGFLTSSIPFADADVTFYHGGILWQLNVGQVKPFVVVTGGVTEIDTDLPGVDEEFRVSAAIGGGVKLILTDHLGLRLEGRAFFTDVNEDAIGCCGHEEDNTLFQGQAAVGLIFRF